MADEPPATDGHAPSGPPDDGPSDSGHAGDGTSRRPGLADRPPGARLRRWELVIVLVIVVIVVVAVVAG
jgi:hypothetical protein